MSQARSNRLSPEDLGDPEFLEREREIRQLKQYYNEARKGHKRCVLLTGPKGVGKSRLFAEFQAREMSSSHTPYLVDFTDEDAPQIRVRPIILALAKMAKDFGSLPKELTQGDGSLDVDLGTMEFLLQHYKKDSDDDLLGNTTGTEDQAWSAMTQFVVEHAKRGQPINLLLEGLEQADTASVRFLEFFMTVPEAKGAHIFVAGTYRDDDKSAGNHFSRSFPKIRRGDTVEELKVLPLLSRSVPSFLSSVVGRLTADDKVYDEAYKLTKGVPELLLSFVEGLAEKGVIHRDGQGWKIDADAAAISALPREVEDQLIAGAKRLGKKHRDALQWSTVIGDEFDMAQIATLSGLSGTHLGFVITDLTRDRYWDELDDRKPRAFTHPSPRVRQAIYESIAERQRKKMHLKVAAEFEKQSPPPASALADHYLSAGNEKKELQWKLAAAREAYRAAQWTTSLGHVERVLEMLGAQKKPNPAEQAEAHLWKARALRRQRKLREAEESIKEGLRLAALARDAFSGELKGEHALCRQARRDFSAYDAVKAAIDGGGECARSPELLVTMADFLRLRNRPKKAIEWLEAVDKDHPDFPVAEGRYRLTRGLLQCVRGKWDKSDENLVRAEQICREQRAFGLLAQALHALAELREIQGHIPEALSLVTSGVQYAEDYQDPSIEARLHALAARLLAKSGDGAEGFSHLKKARRRARKADRQRITAYINLEVCRWYAHMKTFDDGVEAGRDALERFETIKDRWGGAGCYFALARLYSRAGNLQQAFKYYKFAMEYYRELGAEWMGAYIAAPWAQVCARGGKPKRHERLIDEGLAVCDKYGLPEARALLLLEKGRKTDDARQAMEWSREAHQLLRGAGNKMEAKRARILYEREKANADSGQASGAVDVVSTVADVDDTASLDVDDPELIGDD